MTNETPVPPAQRGTNLSSKLERPPLPERLVSRPRLMERLDEARNGRATLIVAPAGYGKTTLALQWLWGGGMASAWVALDGGDRDLERFVRYVVAALRPFCGNGLRRTRALLEARLIPPGAYLTDVLVADLAEVRQRLVLVLEDYHAIDRPEIHALVERMVEVLPPALHLLVLSRVDPPWPLMRWQTRGWLSQLRARDLCFSRVETGSTEQQMRTMSTQMGALPAIVGELNQINAKLHVIAGSMDSTLGRTGRMMPFSP